MGKNDAECLKASSLNPCFNGRYSLSAALIYDVKSPLCLNPCFNGRYSLRLADFNELNNVTRLNPCFNGRYSLRIKQGLATVSSVES